MTPYRPLLDFWFGPGCLTRWRALGALHEPEWRPDPLADSEFQTRFGDLVDRLAGGSLEPWLAEPRSRLAYVLVADLLPRSFYRGSKQAYAFDQHALDAVETGISLRYDRELTPIKRAFFYMPLTHSESGAQQSSVACYRSLVDIARADTDTELQPVFETFLRSAQRHAAIIACFGRFPHRNAVLRRPATAEEQVYLADPWGYIFQSAGDS